MAETQVAPSQPSTNHTAPSRAHPQIPVILQAPAMHQRDERCVLGGTGDAASAPARGRKLLTAASPPPHRRPSGTAPRTDTPHKPDSSGSPRNHSRQRRRSRDNQPEQCTQPHEAPTRRPRRGHLLGVLAPAQSIQGVASQRTMAHPHSRRSRKSADQLPKPTAPGATQNPGERRQQPQSSADKPSHLRTTAPVPARPTATQAQVARPDDGGAQRTTSKAAGDREGRDAKSQNATHSRATRHSRSAGANRRDQSRQGHRSHQTQQTAHRARRLSRSQRREYGGGRATTAQHSANVALRHSGLQVAAKRGRRTRPPASSTGGRNPERGAG